MAVDTKIRDGSKARTRAIVAAGAVVAVLLAGLGSAWALGAFNRDVQTGASADYPFYPTWDDLTERSVVVVTGIVTSVDQRELDPALSEQTVATVEVDAVANGPIAPGSTIEVTYPGPSTPVDQLLESGGSYVLVLDQYGDTTLFQFANPYQCVYPIVGGTPVVSPPNTFLPPDEVLARLGLS